MFAMPLLCDTIAAYCKGVKMETLKSIKPKKASTVQAEMFNVVRKIGIKTGILGRSFPSLKKLHLYYVDSKNLDFGGYGGYAEINGQFQPFIVVNLDSNKTVRNFMATVAHEILHVEQVRNKKDASHNNKFRKDCAKFAKLLGVSYYQVMGYDAPSKKTAEAMGKKLEKNLLTLGKDKNKKQAIA